MCTQCQRNQLSPEFETILYEDEAESYSQVEYELLPEFEILFPGNISRNSNAYIRWVQSSLNHILGLQLTVDGIRGIKTRSAIRNFQARKSLQVDGIVGPRTEATIIQALNNAPGQPPAPIPVQPGTNWSTILLDRRILYVMERLVNQYGLPVNGASGLVGNLVEESSLIPNRVEGSSQATPMRARNFQGGLSDFTATEIMNRNSQNGIGPKFPGIGLAQWTSANRRNGLFQHQFNGTILREGILFDMDAQIDYLVTELRNSYKAVYNLITGAGVSVNDASDEVVYRFEVPGSVLGGTPRRLLPRNDPRVQTVFARRRQSSHQALKVYRNAHP